MLKSTRCDCPASNSAKMYSLNALIVYNSFNPTHGKGWTARLPTRHEMPPLRLQPDAQRRGIPGQADVPLPGLQVSLRPRRQPPLLLVQSHRAGARLILHVKGNGSEVNRNEGLQSKLRVKQNRLVRRTHGYSKRLYMLVGSLAMASLRDGPASMPARLRNTRSTTNN